MLLMKPLAWVRSALGVWQLKWPTQLCRTGRRSNCSKTGFRTEDYGLCDTPRAAWSSTPNATFLCCARSRNSRFVSHEQLFDFMKFGGFDHCRSSFNWRTKRLRRFRPYFSLRGRVWRRIGRLSDHRQGLPCWNIMASSRRVLHSNTEHLPHPSQVLHSLELNAIQLALADKTCSSAGNRSRNRVL